MKRVTPEFMDRACPDITLIAEALLRGAIEDAPGTEGGAALERRETDNRNA